MSNSAHQPTILPRLLTNPSRGESDVSMGGAKSSATKAHCAHVFASM